jgi:hypothetical protein
VETQAALVGGAGADVGVVTAVAVAGDTEKVVAAAAAAMLGNRDPVTSIIITTTIRTVTAAAEALPIRGISTKTKRTHTEKPKKQ